MIVCLMCDTLIQYSTTTTSTTETSVNFYVKNGENKIKTFVN